MMLQRPRVIAVIDPHASCREMLQILMEDEGYQVISGADVNDVHALLVQTQPDVLILDLGPTRWDMDEHVRRLLHSLHAVRQSRLILCSTDPHYLSAHEQVFQELGCASLAKPFDIETLAQVVRTALQLTRRRTQERETNEP